MNPTTESLTSFLVMDVLERANELQREGIDVIHLEVGEPDFDVPTCVGDAVRQALDDHQTHYTHSLGDPELREEIARLYRREYGVEVDPDCIIVTTGSSPAILFAMLLLCNIDSEIILSNPGYACYKNFILAAHGNPVYVPLSAQNGFQYNVEDIRRNITPRTAGIFINSPMNPTGALLEESFFEQLGRIADPHTGAGIPIISDEIYHGLVYGNGKAHSILEYTDNAFVLNGFSKRFAMTGLRLGYLIAPKRYMPVLWKMQQNFLICASSTAQKAGIAALRDLECDGSYCRAMRSTYDERRIFMLRRLREIGFEIPKDPEGAFYIFADAHRFTNDSLRFAFDVLENAHVGITPGVDFGTRGEGFVRFSYANSLERIREALDRIERYVKGL